MRKYKKLQDNVNNTFKQMRNEEFLNSLKAVNEQNTMRKQKFSHRSLKYAMASYCVVFVLLVALISGVFFLPIGDEFNVEKTYSADNEFLLESTLEELNNCTSYIDLIDSNDWRISKVIDKVYNDILYFNVSYSPLDDYFDFNFTIVVNKDYEYQFLSEPFFDSEYNFDNYKLLYYEKLEIDEGLCFAESSGKIVTEQEIIYVQYNGVGFDGESPFINALRDLLIF